MIKTKKENCNIQYILQTKVLKEVFHWSRKLSKVVRICCFYIFILVGQNDVTMDIFKVLDNF